jgi:transposase
MTIPGIGPVGATALAASVTDPHQFRSGRQFAAWLGLMPLQKSSGGNPVSDDPRALELGFCFVVIGCIRFE